MHDSLKAGINLIDCAPWYGHGKAEKVLGEAFKGVPRKAFYFTTKVGRYNPGITEMFDFRAERTLQSIDESLERTGLTYIDCAQVHDPEFAPNLDIVVNETEFRQLALLVFQTLPNAVHPKFPILSLWTNLVRLVRPCSPSIKAAPNSSTRPIE